MQFASKDTQKILEILTSGLRVGDARKIDCTAGAFMPLSVERVGEDLFSTAHYFESQGDLVPDPDVLWWKSPDGWLPAAIQHPTGLYVQTVELSGGKPVRYWARELRDLVSFCNTWLPRNFVEQQGGIDAIRKAVRAGP